MTLIFYLHTTMTPLVSIIIPCYDAQKYLGETLDCLLNQTLRQWECIVVNDGSTDDSLTILRHYERLDSRFKVIDKKNEGPAIARNLAISSASGKYIMPLDADDKIAPSFAEMAADYLEKNPDCKLVCSECDFFGDRSGRFALEDYDYRKILWSNCIVCTAVYRKSDFEKTTGYNPNMKAVYEDWDFWLSLLNEGDRVYRIPKVMFFYRVHGSSRSTQNSDVYRAAMRTLVKNHPDKYAPYMEDIISYYNDSRGFDAIRSSLSFRLGRIMTSPFVFLKKFFRR